MTYAVPREVLSAIMPPGLEPDTREGVCFASLVTFDFLDTRVLGVRWPGFVNFPEVNLRFYVREGARRGVCFVKELVPSRVVSSVARAVYNEPYAPARMRSRVEREGEAICVRHWFSCRGGKGEVEVQGVGPAQVPAEDSEEHFFKEHTWGFGRSRRGKLLRYRVEHPVWATYRIESCRIDVDWGGVYGAAWEFLKGANPVSVVLAEGSAVRVFPVGTLAVGNQVVGSP